MRMQQYKKKISQLLLGLVCLIYCMGPTTNAAAESSLHKENKDVQLQVDGLKACLSNGIIEVKFSEDATVNSLKKNNVELVNNLPEGKKTFYIDYYAEKKARSLVIDELKIIENTPDIAHIAYVDKNGMLYVEYHIILKKGDSGLYGYSIVKNNLGRPIDLSELRSVYRVDPLIFDHVYNAERQGSQLLSKYMKQNRKIQDETYEMPDGEKYTNGKIYSKYDYAGYYKDNPFWGQYGHGFGFWFIPVSTEYYPGGPLKQDLLVHYDAITLNYLTSAHFGTGDFMMPQNWQKFYGPWFVYVNEGSEKEAIEDAKEKARQEKKQWPYSWVNEELYPLKRSLVKGKILLTHDRPTNNLMVVLAKPGSDIIRQPGGYIFYGQTDQHGEFQIDHVRSGEYSLYAYETKGDVTSELVKNDIEVGGQTLNIGTIKWDAVYHKNKIWQIGSADRTAKEFKYGSELRNYKWQEAVPENLDYIVGQSSPSTDWFFAQAKTGIWNIHFNLQYPLQKKYYLTISLAAFTKNNINGQDGDLTIEVNGQKVKSLSYPNDTTVYRSAVQSGWNHLAVIELDGAVLKVGENKVSLKNNNTKVMYDTILLESD